MNTKRAIDILQALRYTSIAAEGCTGEALDYVIGTLEDRLVLPNIDSIIKAVSHETHISEEEMIHRGRKRDISDARAIVSWLAYHYTPMTLKAIGRRFGRDHVMAIHYNRSADEWLKDPKLNFSAVSIIKKIAKELEDA